MWKKIGVTRCIPRNLNQKGIDAINGAFMAVTMAIVAGMGLMSGNALLTHNVLHNLSDVAALTSASQVGACPRSSHWQTAGPGSKSYQRRASTNSRSSDRRGKCQ